MIAAVLFDEGALSGKRSLKRTERELAGPGRPGTADGLVAKVERREAQRPTSLGARGALAARGGYVTPASKGTRWCPGASRRSIPSRTCREGLPNLGRFAPRECQSVSRHSGARPLRREPGIHNHDRRLWIPGLRQEAHPGMTKVAP